MVGGSPSGGPGQVSITPPTGEPHAAPWREVPIVEFVDLLLDAVGRPTCRPGIIAVDGRSAGGKTTLATLIHEHIPDSVVVHTDDVAWHHSFFDWSDLLARGVLEPLVRGEAVHYRPPAWDARGRPGAIQVAPDLDLVVVEGVGAGRRELAHLLDAVLWVQSDFAEAERRGIARDVAEGVNGDLEQATAFWHEWMGEELPFVADQRTWERACLVVAGTPPQPGHVLIGAVGAPERPIGRLRR